jgi:hypothetical protein
MIKLDYKSSFLTCHVELQNPDPPEADATQFNQGIAAGTKILYVVIKNMFAF